MHREIAYLLEGRDGPVLVYLMDAQDWDQARGAYRHPRWRSTSSTGRSWRKSI